MRRIGVTLLLTSLALVVAFGFYGWRPAIPPSDQAKPDQFEASAIERGAKLAAIGNCAICHTRAGDQVNAGGRAIKTPFGTIYSTNITPDPATGIGRWSFAAFERAMRDGVDREGRHLYPAFPYDHFTLVSEEDNQALYAFLMTRQAVNAPALRNDLSFPFNARPLIAGWKLLNFTPGAYRNNDTKSATWNRGAYLAEGLGHCGACHTPRDSFGAEKRGQQFAGGHVDDWFAYAINKDSPAPVPWQLDSLHVYLRQGWHAAHGISRGPMAPVTQNLGSVDDGDVRAIAEYVVDRMNERGPRRGSAPGSRAEVEVAGGHALFRAACETCHDGSRPLPLGGIALHLSSAVHAPDPTNIINVILKGLPPAPGERSPIMPGFDAVITDTQIVDLLRYMRAAFSREPAWADLPALVASQRSKVESNPAYASDGHLAAPAQPNVGATTW